MPVPSFIKFLPLILEKMKDGKSYRRNAEELRSPVRKNAIDKFGVTKEDLSEELKTGGSRFEDRIGWAFTFLIKAEFIEKDEKEKFHYRITKLGLNCLEDITKNNKEMDEKYLRTNSPNYLKNWNFTRSKNDNIVNEENVEELDLDKAIEEINQKCEAEFIAKIRKIEWSEFEDFCAILIQKMNYGVASKREIRTRDGGIDGIIYTDELGIKDKIYIQAKRYADTSNVSAKDMKEFLYNITESKAKGIFITTSRFSQDAMKAAEKFQNGQIALIDEKKLIQLCKKYYHGFKIKANVELLEVDGDIL